MTKDDSNLAMNAICYAASAWQQAAYSAENFWRDINVPSVKFRPAVYPDGNRWCALYGDNLQNGVCGFGDTPELAMRAFDLAWLNERTVKP